MVGTYPGGASCGARLPAPAGWGTRTPRGLMQTGPKVSLLVTEPKGLTDRQPEQIAEGRRNLLFPPRDSMLG